MSTNEKKIGILTIHDSTNYGAVLQAFALNKYIQDLGYKCQVIDYQQHELFKYTKVLSLARISWNNYPYKTPVRKLKLLISLILSAPRKYRRLRSFKRFRNKYINLSNPVNSSLEINVLGYTDLICGSDQIWNPQITDGIDKVYFADVDGKSNKISYAASIGKERYEPRDEQIVKELIEKMDYCSVREEQSVVYLETFVNKHIEQVVDPVFLLKREVYENIAFSPLKIKPYVFLYCVIEDNLAYRIAKKIADNNELSLVEVWNDGSFRCDNIRICDASPQRFLGYIKNARFVITNSFHGLAFSIIMGKEFFVVNNKWRGTRITDLLKMMDLEDRLYTDLPIEMPKEIDYTKPYMLLTKNVEKSKNFLNRALQRM